MSTLLLSETDPRGPKAVLLATDAGQWLRCRDRDGRKVYGIPSSQPDRYYLTGRNFCTCPARSFAPGLDCKHMLAVQLHVEYMRERSGKPRRYQSGPFKGVVISERED